MYEDMEANQMEKHLKEDFKNNYDWFVDNKISILHQLR